MVSSSGSIALTSGSKQYSHSFDRLGGIRQRVESVGDAKKSQLARVASVSSGAVARLLALVTGLCREDPADLTTTDPELPTTIRTHPCQMRQHRRRHAGPRISRRGVEVAPIEEGSIARRIRDSAISSVPWKAARNGSHAS